MYRTPLLILILVLAMPLTNRALAQSVTIVGEELDPSIQQKAQELIGELETPDTRFTARRQARRAASIVLEVLNSEGWLDAKAETAVEAGNPPRPLIRVAPGERFTFGAINIDIKDRSEREFPATNDDLKVKLQLEDYVRATTIIDQESDLIDQLRKQGFANARSLERSLMGDRQTAQVDLTYNLYSGNRICLGDIELNNPGRTRQTTLTKLSPFQSGDIYTPQALETFRRRISETRLYAYSNVVLSEEAKFEHANCETRNVIVSLEDAKRRTVSAGVSYSTADGFGLQAGYEMRNYTGRSDTISFDLLLSSVEQSLAAQWKQPLNGGYRHSLILGTEIAHEETDAYDRNALTLNGLYERPWIKNVMVSGGVGLEIGQETIDGKKNDFQIISGLAGMRFDTTDNPLDPTQGLRAFAQVEPAYALGDTNGQFITTQTDLRAYTGLMDEKLILAGRVKLGTIFGSSFADIPTSRRFFSGGGGSVRGYEYQSIGPQDNEGDPIGGRSIIETNLEARWRFKENMGLVAFVDAGEVSETEHPAMSDIRIGAGLGFRYFTSFGPLRVDMATPVDPRPGDDRLQIYISIGQAF